MTLVVETGSGVLLANSYVTTGYVDTYLLNRGRSTENSWSSQDDATKAAKCIAATQYIDTRWGQRFKGTRLTYFDGASAAALLSFTGQPSADEVVVVGDYTYTFKSALSALSADFEVLIGTAAADTAANLANAISDGGTNGTDYSSNIIANQSASAAVDDDTDTLINLTARQEGLSGNDITLTTTAGNITPTVFVNGRDGGTQPLEFPRASLYDQDGIQVVGVPRRVKEACAEYAVRAANAELYPDPVVDASGRAVTRQKVGPIVVQFADGASMDLMIKPYPAADRLLTDYVFPAGRVYRG